MVRKILLAEDSPTIQKVFELSLAKSDVALTVVDNGADAVRLAAEIAPDLVAVDVSLPVKDGFEVAEELGKIDRTRRCPVLLLSGTLAAFDEERFKGSGAGAVLFKPFESQELVNKIEELLRTREEAAPAGREEPAAGAEPWDFSDVLEEVEGEAAGKLGAQTAPRAEDLLGGAVGVAERDKPAASLEEFDVSLDDLREPEREPAPPPAEPPSAGPQPGDELLWEPVAHLEGSPALDAPPAVTDLSTALDEVEEIEEIEDLEEVDVLREEAGRAGTRATAPPRPPAEGPPAAPPAEPAHPARAPGPDLEPVPAAAEEASSAEISEALRTQFSARAREICEQAVADAVEKVMWEWMDRLSQEFSARIRESVEAVAWEVIPETAETLIREEIARIRTQFEKKSPSSR